MRFEGIVYSICILACIKKYYKHEYNMCKKNLLYICR